MLKIKNTLINPSNICRVDRYEKITKNPMEPGIMEDYFRLSILFLNGKLESISFDSLEELNTAFLQLEHLS